MKRGKSKWYRSVLAMVLSILLLGSSVTEAAGRLTMGFAEEQTAPSISSFNGKPLEVSISGLASPATDIPISIGSDNGKWPSVSLDGRFIVFESKDPIISADDNEYADIFLYDRVLDTVEMVTGVSGKLHSVGQQPIISADGNTILFSASDPSSSNEGYDLYAYDRQVGLTVQLAQKVFDYQGAIAPGRYAISADGTYAAYWSFVYEDYYNYWDLYLIHIPSGHKTKITETSSIDMRSQVAISADGQKVAFDRVNPDTYMKELFVYDAASKTLSAPLRTAPQFSSISISADGRYVGYILWNEVAASFHSADSKQSKPVQIANLPLDSEDGIHVLDLHSDAPAYNETYVNQGWQPHEPVEDIHMVGDGRHILYRHNGAISLIDLDAEGVSGMVVSDANDNFVYMSSTLNGRYVVNQSDSSYITLHELKLEAAEIPNWTGGAASEIAVYEEDESSVSLSWPAIADSPGGPDSLYHVVLTNEETRIRKTVAFTKQTSIEITGLEPLTQYKIEVIPGNENYNFIDDALLSRMITTSLSEDTEVHSVSLSAPFQYQRHLALGANISVLAKGGTGLNLELVVTYLPDDSDETATKTISLTEDDPNLYRAVISTEGMRRIDEVKAQIAGNAAVYVLAGTLPITIGGSARISFVDPGLEQIAENGYLKLRPVLATATPVYAAIQLNEATKTGGYYELTGLPAGDYAVTVTTVEGLELILVDDTDELTISLAEISNLSIEGAEPVVFRSTITLPGGSGDYSNWLDVQVFNGNRFIYSKLVTIGQMIDVRGDMRKGDTLRLQIDPYSPYLLPINHTIDITKDGITQENIVLEKRSPGQLTGVVRDYEGNPLANATVAANQYFNGSAVSNSKKTNAMGEFTLDMLEGKVAITVSHAAYETPLRANDVELHRDHVVTQNFQFVYPPPSLVKLNIYTKYTGGEWIGPLELDWRTNVHLGLHSSTHSSSEAEGLNIRKVHRALPGDNVQFCVNGYQASLPKACGETVLSDDSNEIPVIEIRLEQSSIGVTGRVPVVNSDPLSVMLELYRVDDQGQRSFLKTMSALPYFSFNLDEPGRYWVNISGGSARASASREFDVREGELLDLGMVQLVPRGTFDSKVFLSSYDVMPGQSIQVRVEYTNLTDEPTDDTSIILPLPAGTELAFDRAMRDGQQLVIDQSSAGRAIVDLGTVAARESATVVYFVRLQEQIAAERITMNPSMTFNKAGSPAAQTLQSAFASVSKIRFNVPDAVSRKQFTIRGTAPSSSIIALYDKEHFLGETTVAAAGRWAMEIELPGITGTASQHQLTAEAMKGNERWISNPQTLYYKPQHPEIKHVMMQQGGDRSFVFNPADGVAVFPFVYVPSQSITVEVDFGDTGDLVNSVRVRVGDRMTKMSEFAKGKYRAYVYTSKPGAVYVDYTVEEQYVLDELPAEEEVVERLESQLPPSYRDIQWDEPIVTSRQGAAGQTFFQKTEMKGSMTVEDQEIEHSIQMIFEEVTYEPTVRDIELSEATGIQLYGFTQDYAETDDGISFSFTGYIPYELFEENGYALDSSKLFNIFAKQEKPVKISRLPAAMKAVKATVQGASKAQIAGAGFSAATNYKSVSDTWKNKSTLDKITELIELAQQGCEPAEFDEYYKELDGLYKRFMGQESAKWGMMAAGAAAAPATFGLGTIAIFALTELVGMGMDHSLNKKLDQLKDEIISNINCNDPPSDPVAEPVWIYDPSGYVYEVEESNRLADVTATVFYWESGSTPDDGRWRLWDAEWFGQENPQFTNDHGRYAWDVPEGLWKVVYEKEGYRTAQSDALTVLPPHTDVNIAMESLLPPEPVAAIMNPERTAIDFWFNRHVDVSTATEIMITAEIEAEDGETYLLDGEIMEVGAIAYGESELSVAKHFRLVLSSPLLDADERTDVATLHIRSGIESYSGVPLLETRAITVDWQDAPPSAVSDAAATMTEHEAMIHWQDPTDFDFSEIVVSWKADGSADTPSTETVMKGEEYLLISNLDAAAPYEITLVAKDAAGNSSEAIVLQATTVSPAISRFSFAAPAPVENAKVEVSGNRIDVTWDEVDMLGNLSKVHLSWMKSGVPATLKAIEIAKGTGAYSITGLDWASQYDLVIRAVDGNGNQSDGVMLTASIANAPVTDGPGNGGNDGEPKPTNPPVTPPDIPGEESDEAIELPDQDWLALSPAFHLQWEESEEVEKPFKLKLAYDSTLLRGENPKKLGIYREDPQQPGIWYFVGGLVSNDEVEAEVWEQGKYAVLLYNPVYSDLLNHWSREEVGVLISRHFVQGVGNRQFQPDRTITRAEMARMLVQVLKHYVAPPQTQSTIIFDDVAPGAWYAEDVKFAVQWGLIQGYQGLFRPNDEISRQEMAVLLARAAVIVGESVDGPKAVLDPFIDRVQVATWSEAALAFAVNEQLMQGIGNTRLQPEGSATRAQAAAVIYRFLAWLDWL